MTPKQTPSPKAVEDMNKYLAKKWNKLTKKHVEKKVAAAK